MKKLILALLLFTIPAQASEVAFSPHGGGESLVLKTIAGANKSIYVAAYSFTSKPVTTALIDARARGVDIWLVADKSNLIGRGEKVSLLIKAGVPVHYQSCYHIFHHKFLVVDDIRVQAGSFNYSAAAAKSNAENVIVIDDKAIAGQYKAEWQRLWAESSTTGECLR